MTSRLKRFIPLVAFLLLLSSAAMADSSRDDSWRGSHTSDFTQDDNNHWDEDGGRPGRKPIAVPEPSSIAFAGVGLLGVLEAIRRKARL
jgi:hypothetical protein